MSDIGASLRRHWRVPIVALVLIPLVMAAYLANRDVERPPARYTTSADLLIPARGEDDAPEGVPPVLLQGQIELALSSTTRQLALEGADQGDGTAEGIQFDARLSPTQTIMTLSVSALHPEPAAAVLDEYIVAYENGRRQSVLDAAIERAGVDEATVGILRRRIDAIQAALTFQGLPFGAAVPDGSPVVTPPGLPDETVLTYYERNALLNEMLRRQVDYSLQITVAAIPGDFVTVVQRRSAARITPPPPSPLLTLIQILAGGLLLAVVIPVLMDRLDSTITEARAAPRALRSGTLATIPHLPRRLQRGFARPGSTWDQAFRSLAATSLTTDRLPAAIMVTSPTGSTQDSVAANFAAALAGLGVTVALVGTVPRQSWFADEGDVGDLEAEETEREAELVPAAPAAPVVPETPRVVGPTFAELLQDAETGQLTGDLRPRLGAREPNFYVIPPSDDEVDLSLDGLPPLLDALSRSGIDITVIAGPALLEDPNATIVAWSTRHVLWAIQIGAVNTRDAHLAADRLELAGVSPFGIAIVNRHARDRSDASAP